MIVFIFHCLGRNAGGGSEPAMMYGPPMARVTYGTLGLTDGLGVFLLEWKCLLCLCHSVWLESWT